MDFPLLLQQTQDYVLANPIELWGTIFGLLCVYFNARANILGWPTGLVSVGLYTYIFWHAQLFGEFALHIVFFVLSVYGWWHWYFGGGKADSLPVTHTGRREHTFLLLASGAGSLLAGWFLRQHMGSELAYLDAAVLCFSLGAQWLLAQKRVENWLWWLAIDTLCVGIYYYKGLYITMVLYLLYLGLATMGYLSWKRQLQEQQAEAAI